MSFLYFICSFWVEGRENLVVSENMDFIQSLNYSQIHKVIEYLLLCATSYNAYQRKSNKSEKFFSYGAYSLLGEKNNKQLNKHIKKVTIHFYFGESISDMIERKWS